MEVVDIFNHCYVLVHLQISMGEFTYYLGMYSIWFFSSYSHILGSKDTFIPPLPRYRQGIY